MSSLFHCVWKQPGGIWNVGKWKHWDNHLLLFLAYIDEFSQVCCFTFDMSTVRAWYGLLFSWNLHYNLFYLLLDICRWIWSVNWWSSKIIQVSFLFLMAYCCSFMTCSLIGNMLVLSRLLLREMVLHFSCIWSRIICIVKCKQVYDYLACVTTQNMKMHQLVKITWLKFCAHFFLLIFLQI